MKKRIESQPMTNDQLEGGEKLRMVRIFGRRFFFLVAKTAYEGFLSFLDAGLLSKYRVIRNSNLKRNVVATIGI